jgi:uncharacterized protein YdaU (DUF1376 family)
MRAPAFQFYVQDFLTGTMHMTAEEIGVYILLLCHAWDKGHLNPDEDNLRRLGRCRYLVLRNVLSKFEKGEDGLLRNARQEQVRKDQTERRARRSAANQSNAQRRWQTDKTSTASVIEQSNDAHIIVGKKRYEKRVSELLWDLFQEPITEMMQNRYEALRLQAVFDELESQCPSGCKFNSEQHLLNKFRSVADALLRTVHQRRGRTDQPVIQA